MLLYAVQSKQLVKVALLNDEHRHHFAIDSRTDNRCQMAQGQWIKASSCEQETVYYVTINFSGGIFGIFTQTVVFDFGQRPVLVRQLKMELEDRLVLEKVVNLRKKLHFDRLQTTLCYSLICHII